MSEESFQERTEEATPKKKKQAKEQGMVARSKEFNTMIVLLSTSIGLFVYAKSMFDQMKLLLHDAFVVSASSMSSQELVGVLAHMFKEGLMMLVPVFIIVWFSTSIGSLLIGGFSISFSNIAVKFERLDPIKGLAKIVSLQSFVELFKSILKITLVIVALFVVFALFYKKIINLADLDITISVPSGYSILSMSFFILASTLIIVALIDVPFQLYQFYERIRMTKQEIRDEYKESEGNPETKSKIMRVQREIANRRMMSYVPKADAIITNPTHFAVAIKYDQSSMKAPRVVAKGADLVASKIMDIGRHHDVPIISMPPLARSLFYFTELGDEIPSALYVAVAQVLAYIHQLKLYRRGKTKRPVLPKNVEIPEAYQK